MFHVKVTDGLEKALKVLKGKVQKTKMVQELRSRQEYTKPSEKRRAVVKNAIYREDKYGYKD